MAKIEIRAKAGMRSPDDLTATVQDTTYDYLLNSPSPSIRISAYLDRDWDMVQAKYAEVFVDASCAYESRIEKMIPGSKMREGVKLPGPMKIGEQLTVIVARTPKENPPV